MCMQLVLNKVQREFFNFAKKKGHVSIDDAGMFWTSSTYRKNNLMRFVSAGILKHSEIGGRFDYVTR